MRHKPMEPGTGLERPLQRRYLSVARAMRARRPHVAENWATALDTWRDCVMALCTAYTSEDEDFSPDVFKHHCNW